MIGSKSQFPAVISQDSPYISPNNQALDHSQFTALKNYDFMMTINDSGVATWETKFMRYAGLMVIAALFVTSSLAHAAETITYKYDARGRLKIVTRTGTVNNNVTTTYGHDKANNRKAVVVVNSPNASPP
jgi:YD repeat-containing protein